MKLLGIRLCDHDSNITITDGTKVQYHKTERYYGVKHHHMGFDLKDYLNKKDICQYVQCKPNRVVIFDGTIPHLIRPSTMAAPHHRWSINMTFYE